MVAVPIALVGAMVGIPVALMATRPEPERREEEARMPAAQVAVAETVSRALAVQAQGLTRARQESDLAPQVAGRVIWVSPSLGEGGAFRAGEVMARLETADYELALTRAASEVARAREQLIREEAEASLARQDWAELGDGSQPSPLVLREPQLAQARAALAAAEAARRSAQLDLERTAIRAPFTGRVLERRVGVGQYVAPGTPVARVFATDVAEVRLPLTDADLAALSLTPGFVARGEGGPRVVLTDTVAGAERRWTGRVIRTDAAIDAQTRQVFAIVEVRDPFSPRWGAPLAPGSFVVADIASARTDTFVRIPREALRREDEVIVVDAEGVVDVRTVEVAQSGADGAFLRSGVSAGERVVTSALADANDGDRITIIGPGGSVPSPADTAAPAGAAPPATPGKAS
jgi:RND family efflux transporter MFP subunit